MHVTIEAGLACTIFNTRITIEGLTCTLFNTADHNNMKLTDTSVCYHRLLNLNFMLPKRRFWKEEQKKNLDFMLPKRRFWKAEQTFQNALSKHFSRV